MKRNKLIYFLFKTYWNFKIKNKIINKVNNKINKLNLIKKIK